MAVALPVMLHDIDARGFSAVATDKLTHGAAYDLRFALHPETIVLKARLATLAHRPDVGIVVSDEDGGAVVAGRRVIGL